MLIAETQAEKFVRNLLFLSYVLLGAGSLLFWNPHFEESFSQWKLIMGMSAGYTHSYHHFNDLFVLQSLYEWLYAVNNRFPWFPVSLWLVSYAASGGILFVLWQWSRQRQTPLVLTFLLLLSALLLLSVNWLWIHHNRTAFLLGLLGSLVLAYKVSGSKKQSARVAWAAGSLALVCLSIMFRAEAGIAVSLLLLPSVVYICAKVRTGVVWGLLPALPVTLALGYFFYQAETSSDFRWQLEPDVEHELMDRRNLAPLHAQATGADSARQYAVALNWMLGDVEKNNATYVRSLINKPATWAHRYLFFMYPSAAQVPGLSFGQRVIGFLQVHCIYFILLLGLLLTAAGSLAGVKRLHMALFVAGALLLLASSFTVNQYNRITQPLMAVTFCWALYLWIGSFSKTTMAAVPSQRLWRVVLMACTVLLTGYTLHSNHQTAYTENQLEAQIESRLNRVLQNHPQRTWVVTAANYTAYKTPALQPFTGFGNKSLLLPEIGQYSANPFFLSTIAQLTGCPPTNFECRMQFINNHKSEVIIIANKRRLQLYEYYMQAVYGLNLNWSNSPRIHLADDTYCWLP